MKADVNKVGQGCHFLWSLLRNSEASLSLFESSLSTHAKNQFVADRLEACPTLKVPTLGRTVGIGGLLLLLGGCAMLTPEHPVELDRAPKPAMPAPQSFQAVQSVVFSFYGHSMTGIGMLSMDRGERSFELSCMTPMGTKLFDLQMKNDVPEVLFALPFFTEKEGFAEAVALDIARIYFDREPPQVTRAYRKGNRLWIESKSGLETLAYGYTGDPLVLIEKKVLQKRALKAQIEYRQFFEQEGVRCIAEATLKSEYGYRLTVRTKELKIIE